MNFGPKLPKAAVNAWPTSALSCTPARTAAALEVYHAGGQDDQGRQGADHDGIGEDLKHAPHALMHRLLDVGGRVDHDGRAEAGFVGERAPLEAPGDGSG